MTYESFRPHVGVLLLAIAGLGLLDCVSKGDTTINTGVETTGEGGSKVGSHVEPTAGSSQNTSVSGSPGSGGSCSGSDCEAGGVADKGEVAAAGDSSAGSDSDLVQPQCSSSVDMTNDVAAVVFSDDFEVDALTGISGTWDVDNSMPHTGKNSIHPPMTSAGKSATLEITCGDISHSELAFWYNGYKPTAGQRLRLYIDDTLYSTYGGTNNFDVAGWYKVDIVVPTGLHRYRWDASTDVAAQPPFWIDGIECHNNPILPNTTTQFYFEEGFMPPEIGGDFEIDNSLVQSTDGVFSAHPGTVKVRHTASLITSCGCEKSAGVSFIYNGYKPTAGQSLKFYVDGELKLTLGGTNDFDVSHWAAKSITVPLKVHEYRWDVTTDVGGQPPYWIDTIKCQ